jgi:DNA polymerase III delta prime subunit
MEFTNFEDLINQINSLLATFAHDFQYKRKSLKQAERVASKVLFGNVKDDWAINKGGGNELQYHISIDFNNKIINYGLGLSTLYVPFNNEIASVDYLKPYAKAFIALKPKIDLILDDYYWVFGKKIVPNEIQNGEFYLWGKSIAFNEIEEKYHIEENTFNSLVSDFEEQFEAYSLVFKYVEISGNMKQQQYTSLLNIKPQIILQGAPGTGKTYTAKEIAYKKVFGEPIPLEEEERKIAMKKLEQSEQYKLIQFHPAYTYEDFVRGIVVESAEGAAAPTYSTKNKVLGEFAEKALKNKIDNSKSEEDLKQESSFDNLFEQFAEQIQSKLEDSDDKFPINKTAYFTRVEDNQFRYTGDNWNTLNDSIMKFSDIKNIHLSGITERKEVKNLTNISGSSKQNTTYFWQVVLQFRDFLKENKPKSNVESKEKPTLKNYVLIIDEINRANLPAVMGELIYALEYRNEAVESMYDLDGNREITLPDNLFIIGTMNTADRSVGHIDYAIRRRFAFVDVAADREIIPEAAKPLFDSVADIFTKYIASDFELKDIQIGHSYYMGEGDLSLKLKYEIQPLLREYVKDGILKSSAKDAIEKLSA